MTENCKCMKVNGTCIFPDDCICDCHEVEPVAPAPTASAREWFKTYLTTENLAEYSHFPVYVGQYEATIRLLEAYASSQSEKGAAEIERLSKEITELKLKVAPECYWDDETRYDSAEEYAEEMRLKVGEEFALQAAAYWGERLRVIQIPRPVRDDDIGGGEYICETIETVRPTFEEYWKLLARAEAAESKLSQLQLSNEEKARKIAARAVFMYAQTAITRKVVELEDLEKQILAILNGGQQ